MQSGQWSRVNESSFTLHDFITKYKNEITPKKRGHEVEDRSPWNTDQGSMVGWRKFC